MKYLFILIGILLSTPSFAQKEEIKELITQLTLDIIPSNFNYYNLVDSSFCYHSNIIKLLKDDPGLFLKESPDFPVSDFITTEIDSVVSWEAYMFAKARVLSVQNMPKFYSQVRLTTLVDRDTFNIKKDSLLKNKKYYELIVPVSSKWDKQRVNEEIKNAWTKYEDAVKNEDKTYYSFSTPVFSESFDYAFISVNQPNQGTIYLYRKLHGKWMKVWREISWII